MKNLLRTTTLLCIFLFSFNASSQESSNAPNITFSDLDGVTHDLHTYLDSGYSVILDFSYQNCQPCQHWSINVGHDLWDNFGPDGDNSLRMFFIDVDPVSDEDLQEYTQQWGVEYPVINISELFSEYPVDGYPTLFYICSDKTFVKTSGYGNPDSEMLAHYYIQKCKGNDLSSNLMFYSASIADKTTLCNSNPLHYTPTLRLLGTGSVDEDNFIEQEYQIEIFKNNNLFRTDSIDPWSDGSLAYYDSPELDPIEVSFEDIITFVAHYPNDSFANDDTIKVTIPAEVNTLISSDTILNMNGQSGLYFFIYDANGEDVLIYDDNGEEVNDADGQVQFSLPVDSCYSVVFINPHVYGGSLVDNNGDTLVSFNAGDFGLGTTESPKLYFHISDTVSNVAINDKNHQKSSLISSEYFDALGRRHFINDYTSIPEGIYFEIRRYESGYIEVKKHYKSNSFH